MGTDRPEDRREEFVARLHAHQRILSKVAALYADGPEDREDLVQEIAAELWRSYPSFREESGFSTWAYRVALNTALLRRRRGGALRRSGVTSEQAVVDRAAAPTEPDAVEAREGAELLHACIRDLREVDRAIVLLHLEGRPHSDIAEILGLSTGAVAVRLHRIRTALRRCLAARGYELEAAS